MTTTTTLVFAVPVYVTVSDTKREITQVRVHDEGVPVNFVHACDSEGNVLDGVIDEERISRAAEIARTKDWPEWEVGP